MHPLEALRQAIQQGRYELTLHAVQEAAEDDLHVVDWKALSSQARLLEWRTIPSEATSTSLRALQQISQPASASSRASSRPEQSL